jgi:hypothetical protein
MEWADPSLPSSSSFDPQSPRRIRWRCSDCDFQWHAPMNSRSDPLHDSGCPKCRLTSSLALDRPTLAKEWCHTRNQTLTRLTPESVGPDSDALVWWTCPSCRRDWKATISSRTQGQVSCSHCELHSTVAPPPPRAASQASTRSNVVVKQLPIFSELLRSYVTHRPLDVEELPELSIYDRITRFWKCRTCHNVYSMSLYDRCVLSAPCPSCLSANVAHRARHPSRQEIHFPSLSRQRIDMTRGKLFSVTDKGIRN